MRPSRVKWNVTVLVDAIALQRGYATASETCEIPGFGPINVDVARQILPDALVDVLVHDLVDIKAYATLTRYRRVALDKALQARDRRCVVPRCKRRGHLQVDHRHDHAKGGPTSYDNLAFLCEVHHHEKTHLGARLERVDDEWHWYPPPPGPRPTPPATRIDSLAGQGRRAPDRLRPHPTPTTERPPTRHRPRSRPHPAVRLPRCAREWRRDRGGVSSVRNPDDDDAPVWARRVGDGWLLALRVQPGARRSQVVGPLGEVLKIKVAAPADEGKANAELVRFLSATLDLPSRSVRIVRGPASRTKTVAIDAPLSPSALRGSLAAG